MVVHVVGKRRGAAWAAKNHPGAAVVDVTSKGPAPWLRLSPFHPHGGIPVPFSPSATGESVEGIRQALEVFDGADVTDLSSPLTHAALVARCVRGEW
ncbi:DUF6939 family protein [Umezawaea sp.]|uniref:DUF6939 family protein n=1 Tax=Umezawaea sp. TaxID=1955258 RepID=UPI002ED4E0F2